MGLRWYPHDIGSPVRTRLAAGGRWIRTIGPRSCEPVGTVVEATKSSLQTAPHLARDRWFESVSLHRGESVSLPHPLPKVESPGFSRGCAAGLATEAAQCLGRRGAAIHEIVTPLSTGYTCPVTIRDSSEARKTAMLAMSSGSISPTRCAAASFVTRGLPASSRPRTRSVIVADGAIALTRTLWGANSTAIERVIAAMPPFAAV